MEYQKAAWAMDYKSSTQLDIRTREGDQVSLSINHERSYSRTEEHTVRSDGSEIQSFSIAARAMSSYSLSVEGELNDEEMSAILSLAERLSPLAQGLEGKASGGSDGEGEGIDVPGAIENFRYSMERFSNSSFSGETIGQETLPSMEDFLNPESSGIRDLPALLKSVLDSVFMSALDENRKKGPDVFQEYASLLPFLNDKISEILAPLN